MSLDNTSSEISRSQKDEDRVSPLTRGTESPQPQRQEAGQRLVVTVGRWGTYHSVGTEFRFGKMESSGGGRW